MRNITVAIHDDTYSKIRVWCALRDVSVSRVVRVFLEDLPRLEQVRRFPLPDAPQAGSIGELFDQLDDEEDRELLRRHVNELFPDSVL